MEQDNRKLRDKAKKERNEEVRVFVISFVLCLDMFQTLDASEFHHASRRLIGRARELIMSV